MSARTTRPLRSGAATLGLGLLLATAAPASSQEPVGGAEAEAVRAAVLAHWEAINRSDTETIQAQHLSGGTGFLTEWGSRLGLDADGLAPVLGLLEGSVSDWHPRDIQVRTFGEVAVATFYLDGSVRRGDGTVDAGPRRVTEVWVRTDEGWREAHHHDDPVPPTGARDAVERASDAWWDALLRSDLEASMRTWTDDAVAHPPGGASMSGHEELREGLRAQFETIRLEDLQIMSREIEVMGGVAYEVATYDATVVPVTAGPRDQVEGRYAVIWRREADGSWKVARDIWNFGPAPADPGPGAPGPEAERARIVDQIERRAREWLETGNRRDADALASLVTPDVEFVDFSNHYEGADAYVAGARDLVARFRSWSSAWDRTRVEVLAPDAALFEGRFTLERERNDGLRQESAPFLYMTAVFRLVDGRWRIARGHLSGSVRRVDP